MQKNSSFKISDKLIKNEISAMLLKTFGKNPPVIVCLGSDKVVSDMVGVLVGDLLKKRNIKTLILGGTMQNASKNVAKLLAKNINSKNLLFVDSGYLVKSDAINVSNVTKLNDGSIINYPSITCSTISLKNGKLCLADIRYAKVLKYSYIIADAICDYFSYLDILYNKNICEI